MNIHDILKDKSFLGWLNKSNEEDAAKWEKWRTENPKNDELLESAKLMSNGFQFEKNEMPDHQINSSWNSFADKLDDNTQIETRIYPLRRQILRIAAAILLLTGSWTLYQYSSSTGETITVETAANEIKTIELPDGSTVKMNTNSKIEYIKNWEKIKTRTITLIGEAYFQVKKQDKGSVFQVNTGGVTIEVVGTAFNCNSKRENPIISLTEGKINLRKENTTAQSLVAGQTALFDKTKNAFAISTDKTNYWSSWINQEWSFGDGVSMGEVINRIEETFNVTCEVSDESILQKRASGDVSIENKAVLLEALSFLLDLEIVEKDGKIIFSLDKKPN